MRLVIEHETNQPAGREIMRGGIVFKAESDGNLYAEVDEKTTNIHVLKAGYNAKEVEDLEVIDVDINELNDSTSIEDVTVAAEPDVEVIVAEVAAEVTSKDEPAKEATKTPAKKRRTRKAKVAAE